MDILIPNNWHPRSYQDGLWKYFQSAGPGWPGRRGVAVCHRRWGKDDVALHLTATSAVEKTATYWHMLPEYSQGRKAIWNAVNPHTGKRRIDEAFPPEIRERTRDQDMFIELKSGSTWQVVGSDRFDSVVGSPPYGLVFSEWALANPGAWAYLSPILRENRGWALFIYTARGMNHGYTTYAAAREDPDWYAELQTAEETGVFTPDQLVEARRDLEKIYVDVDEAEAVFSQEYLCDFNAALPGSYYGKAIHQLETEGRIGPCPYDPEYPVYTAWDLGLDDHTAIWFAQVVGAEIRLIDYVETANQSLIDIVRNEILTRRYVYSEHYLPHDVNTREMTTARTRMEAMEQVGLRPIIPGSQLPVADGINAVRNLLRRCRFDRVKTEQGMNALRSYRREWDEKNRTFRQTPKHDWASHGADAFRELAVNIYGVADRESRPPAALTEYSPFKPIDRQRNQLPDVVQGYNPW